MISCTKITELKNFAKFLTKKAGNKSEKSLRYFTGESGDVLQIEIIYCIY